jgi:hypothetical protein
MVSTPQVGEWLSGVLVCDWLPLNFDAASQLPCDLVVC